MAAPHRRPTAPAHPPARLPTTQQLMKRGVPWPLESEAAEAGFEEGESAILRTGGDRDGFVGGGQIGYDYQFTPAPALWSASRPTSSTPACARTGAMPFPALPRLASAPARLATRSRSRRARTQLPALGSGRCSPAHPATSSCSTTGSATGTAAQLVRYRARAHRLRIDRVLFYGTGGLAYGLDNRSTGVISLGSSAVPPGFFVSEEAAAAGAAVRPSFVGFSNRNRSNLGYAVGGGIEYALAATSALSLRRFTSTSIGTGTATSVAAWAPRWSASPTRAHRLSPTI